MFFVPPLKGKNDFWRYLITVPLVFLFMALLGYLPLLGVIGSKVLSGGLDMTDLESFMITMDFEAVGIGRNLGLALILMSFALSLLALWFCLKAFHHRNLKSLINGFEKIRWNRIFFAFGLWLLFSILTEGLSYYMNPEVYTFQFSLANFIPLLIISLTLLPIQTSFEELFFRGYLMQGIGSSGVNVIVPLLLTSVAFGAMHIMNPEVKEFGVGIMMIYYIGSGVFLAVMTIMDDGLELALGTHAATNFFASTCVTFDAAALNTDAILRTSEINIGTALIGFLVLSLLFLFICAKKYNWTDWGKLFRSADLSAYDTPSREDLLLDHKV